MAIHVEITVMWDDKTSTLVEVYRRYVAFVYLYETAHRHMTENISIKDLLGTTLRLFTILSVMTRQSCIICLQFTCALSFSFTVPQPFSIFC
jgi:hypothetical protein